MRGLQRLDGIVVVAATPFSSSAIGRVSSPISDDRTCRATNPSSASSIYLPVCAATEALVAVSSLCGTFASAWRCTLRFLSYSLLFYCLCLFLGLVFSLCVGLLVLLLYVRPV
mmetsp:Transcript_1702/g.3745  ORF Transcript_1702/g.3745 Transcript_1702/m.3745 type:complete len:113 (-) Transcript_1702:63-401(-)